MNNAAKTMTARQVRSTYRSTLYEQVDLLTEQDRREFAKSNTRFSWLKDHEKQAALRDLNEQLVDFWADGLLFTWVLQVLGTLSDSSAEYKLNEFDHEEINISAIAEHFEMNQAECLAEDIAFFEDHGENDTWRWDKGPPSKANHPWGTDTVNLCRWWLEQRPYRVFQLYTELREWGQDLMDERLDEWAFGTAVWSGAYGAHGGCAFHMQTKMERHLKDEITKLVREYEKLTRERARKTEWDTGALPAEASA